jgi:hypothetical protein
MSFFAAANRWNAPHAEPLQPRIRKHGNTQAWCKRQLF